MRTHPARRLWATLETLHDVTYFAAGVRPAGMRAHLLQVADGRFPEAVIRQVRGWPEAEWAAAAQSLRDRGLLTASPVPGLTPAGRAVLAEVESRTDERAWTGGLAPLGEQGAEEVIALLQPSVRAVVASGIMPDVNPTGVPYPG